MRLMLLRLLLITCFILSSAVRAQGTADAYRILDNEIGFGARALGMGGAFMAVADDYSAAYWNASGLALMRDAQLYFGVANLNLASEASYQGRSTDESLSATKLSSIGFAYPLPTIQGSMVLAFGFQKIKDFNEITRFSGISAADNGLSFQFDENGPVYDFFGQNVERAETVSDEGSMNQVHLSGAIDISPNSAVGLTLNYWSGRSEYNLQFDQDDPMDFFNIFPADFQNYSESRLLIAEYSAVNAVLSGMYRYRDRGQFALSIASPITFNINEEFNTTASLTFDTDEVDDFESESGTFEYDVEISLEIAAGAALYFDRVLLAASIRYRDWSQMAFDSPLELQSRNTAFKSEFDATLRYNLGAEILLPLDGLRMRGGYMAIPGALNNSAQNIDRNYVTVGLGFDVDAYFHIDLAGMIGSWERNSSDDLVPQTVNESLRLRKIFITFTYDYK